MPVPGITQDGQKVDIISLNVPRPALLYLRDILKIWKDSGDQVKARVDRFNGFKGQRQLLLRAPLECDDAVFEAARQQAMDIIKSNNASRSPTTNEFYRDLSMKMCAHERAAHEANFD